MSGLERIATIGVYGWTADSFLQELKASRVNVLVDIRARRGVRGAEYAFANHKRLTQALDSFGIGYLHLRELAPTAEVRAIQHQADQAGSAGKRDRRELSAAFRDAYRAQVLAQVSVADIVDAIVRAGTRPVLLCVERDAVACHRSMVSEAIVQTQGGTPEVHLEP